VADSQRFSNFKNTFISSSNRNELLMSPFDKRDEYFKSVMDEPSAAYSEKKGSYSKLKKSPAVSRPGSIKGSAKPAPTKQAPELFKIFAQNKRSREYNSGKKRLDTIVSEGHGNSTQVSALRQNARPSLNIPE